MPILFFAFLRACLSQNLGTETQNYGNKDKAKAGLNCEKLKFKEFRACKISWPLFAVFFAPFAVFLNIQLKCATASLLALYVPCGQFAYVPCFLRYKAVTRFFTPAAVDAG